MKTIGVTAEEAQAAFPGQNINKFCRAYTAPTGTARVLYDLPKGADKPPASEKPKKASKPKAKAEGSETAA